jgi:hypothetical protein
MTDEQKKAVRDAATGGKISCKVALELAVKFDLKPSELGALLDDEGIRVKGCQLGCF